jgi:hypothetical protein
VRVKRNIAFETFARGGRKVKSWERRHGDGKRVLKAIKLRGRQVQYTVYHLLIIRYPSSTPKKPFRADSAKLFSSLKSVIFTVRLTLSGFRK